MCTAVIRVGDRAILFLHTRQPRPRPMWIESGSMWIRSHQIRVGGRGVTAESWALRRRSALRRLRPRHAAATMVECRGARLAGPRPCIQRRYSHAHTQACDTLCTCTYTRTHAHQLAGRSTSVRESVHTHHCCIHIGLGTHSTSSLDSIHIRPEPAPQCPRAVPARPCRRPYSASFP